MSVYLSMAAFALASSITPGPVNVVALSAGARYGWRLTLRHVAGATVGFTALLLLSGLGLHRLLAHWPWLAMAIRCAGVLFLLYMAVKLARDEGRVSDDATPRPPTFCQGALMQWLNPKAWVACVAGMGAFVGNGDERLLWQFAAIYFLVCYASIASWAWAGTGLRRYVREPARMRLFNRSMAMLLAVSAAYLLLERS